ncbi:MafI family immunity protein [Micromonospora vulcania]|uniref:MafI family immunity protein n=1 Tax=Micromonospora vulcania TaxID=1441873 RepID=A0ABW1HBZ7_9ACTN
MELIDFYRLSRRITDQLAPKISPNHRPFVLTAGGAGEWGLAISTLVGALSEEDVVITTAEKDALRELMEFRREPLTYLEQIRTSD